MCGWMDGGMKERMERQRNERREGKCVEGRTDVEKGRKKEGWMGRYRDVWKERWTDLQAWPFVAHSPGSSPYRWTRKELSCIVN